MEYRSVKGYTGAAQLGFLLVFFGLGFIIAGFIQTIIGLQMVPAGTPSQNMTDAVLKAFSDPKNAFYARLAQVSGTFFALFVPAILYSWIANGKNKFWLGFNPYLNVYQVLLGFLIIFTANIMCGSLEEISKSLIAHFPSIDKIAREWEDKYNDSIIALSNLKSWPELLMAVVIMAFFPALFEELFFRGALQNLLVKWWKKPLLAIIITSLIFSLVHVSIYLFFVRAILGFVLGLLYFKTKNIWVNVIAHFLNNVLAVAQLFSQSQSKTKMDVSKLDPKFEWWVGLIALGILVFLFRFLQRYSIKNIFKINAREQLLLAESTSNPFAKNETNELGN